MALFERLLLALLLPFPLEALVIIEICRLQLAHHDDELPRQPFLDEVHAFAVRIPHFPVTTRQAK